MKKHSAYFYSSSAAGQLLRFCVCGVVGLIMIMSVAGLISSCPSINMEKKIEDLSKCV